MSSIEIYKKITDELTDLMLKNPSPSNPSREECLRVEQMRDTLKAMDAQQIGIDPDELQGAIGLAQDHFRRLVRAKR